MPMESARPGTVFTSDTNVADRILHMQPRPRLAPIGPLPQEEMLRSLRRRDHDCSALEKAIASLEDENTRLRSHLAKSLAERGARGS